jgi:flagellar assembly protein FliH
LSTEARPIVFPSLQTSGESEGFTRGHAAGYSAGLRKAEAEARALRAQLETQHTAAREEGQRRLASAVVLLDAAAAALRARTTPVLAEADAELAAAAVALAEAVIGRELSDAPTGAKAALERALSAPDSDAVVAVRLHPADIALLEAELLKTERSTAAQVAFVPDSSLARGDAVAEYPDGELDARIRTAVARARAALAGVTR